MGALTIGSASDWLGYNDSMGRNYVSSVTFEEAASDENGKTRIVISGSCYEYWNVSYVHDFEVYIDGEYIATSSVMRYGDWDNKWYTAEATAEVVVQTDGGQHVIKFISSSSGGAYEFTAELHPRLEIAIKKPEHTKSLVLQVNENAFEEAKTMTESGYAYGGAQYSWSAEADTGYEINPSSGSGTLTEALIIAPVVSPRATIHLCELTEWVPYLLYIFTESDWGLYRAMIYNGSEWEPYY